MIRLTKQQVIALHDELIREIGGISGLRDEGLLDSALTAPFQSFGGQSPYQSLQQKAARLGFGLVQNHPFIDGNKRIGAHVMLVFLAINGIDLDYTQDDLSGIFLEVAAGSTDFSGLLQWLLDHERG